MQENLEKRKAKKKQTVNENQYEICSGNMRKTIGSASGFSLFHAEIGHIFHLSEGLHFPCNGILEKQQMTLLEEAAVSLRVCTRTHTNTHSHTQF